MTDCTLLFLCGGRRVRLLECFRECLPPGGRLRIVTTDTESNAATSFVADRTVLVAPCRDLDAFLDDVAVICSSESVDAVLPLTCAAVATVPALSHRTDARIISGDEAAVRICTDKLATARHFRVVGLATPEVVEFPTVGDLPLFARPRRAEGSRDAYVVRSAASLHAILAAGDRLLTRFVSGTEFTMDCYRDLRGQLMAVVPRERQRIRAGEVERSVTRWAPNLIEQTRVALAPLNFVGPATVQAIIAGETAYFTEINLRFGGGVTLSIAAGTNSPRWLIHELLAGIAPQPGEVRWNLGMSRYDSEFYWQVK